MKNRIKNIITGIFSLMIFVGCSDDDLGVPSGGVAPPFGELTHDISSAGIVLTQEEDSSVFANLSWSALDFGTSKPVKYTIELGYAGEDFKSAVGIVTKENITSYTMLVAEVNAAMISLGVAPDESADVEIRVRAWPDFLTDPSLSDPISLTLTPYLLTYPSRYVVGDAQGWDIANPDILESFAPGIYEGEVRLQSNGNFRFFAAPDWGAEQWGFSTFATGSVPEELINANDSDSNFKFTGITAKYRMVVNFNTQVISIASLGPPPPPSEIFLVSPSVVNFDRVPELEATADGATDYQGVVMLDKNSKFRIFEAKEWSAPKLDWTFFEGGEVDARLMDSGDDQSNIIFTGEPGWFIVTVSMDNASITLEETTGPPIYILGGDQGWNAANAVPLMWMEGGYYEGTADFTNGSTFRLFANNDPAAWDWSGEQWRYNSFAEGTVDARFEDAGGADSNFKFVGTTGTYTIRVDLDDLIVELE